MMLQFCQALKQWKTGLSKLKRRIARCNIVIAFMYNLEDEMPLYITESKWSNFTMRNYYMPCFFIGRRGVLQDG
jgi:hypothetical protein